jgi:DNA sulfur modification protein DndB
MTQVILTSDGVQNFDEKHMVNRPTDQQLSRAYTFVANWWDTVLSNFTPFRRGIERPVILPDLRAYQAEYSLLFRPIGQIAFVYSLVGAVLLGCSLEEVLDYAEDQGWSAADPLFTDTVVYANGHMAKDEFSIKLAGRLGTYLLAGDLMADEAIKRLESDLRQAKADPLFRLPA